jgi:exonuclease III
MKQSNGSRRKPNSKPKLIQQWLYQGVKSGSIDVGGLSYLKLLLLLDQAEFDILCLQETWVAAQADPPLLKGYKLVEQRRPTGARGGLATYVRNSLHIESTSGNEYCLFTKLRLPNS